MMEKKYSEYKQLNLSEIGKSILSFWEENNVFEKSLELRKDSKQFIFYEGPPSANGMPGIHHVMARAIKDIFCRYKTLKGFKVDRKAGWDTHGLPIEIAVEKTLGITKEDIGTKISVEEYNNSCKNEVMKYKDKWDDLTKKIGYWVDLENPYITFKNSYIETCWYLLSELYKKGLLYKGFTIQPYSPAAGTGLSTHELNQPGCYRDVKDNSMVAQFKIINNNHKLANKIFADNFEDTFFLAWTTTPWTLPSNTALAVGQNINYQLIKTYNPYTYKVIKVILAEPLVAKYFSPENINLPFNEYNPGDKNIPYQILDNFKGNELKGLRYEQLLPYVQPEDGDAFVVVIGDFVTTEDGTGIVHIAPSFGADDFKVGKQNNLGSLTLVDKSGKFVDTMGEFAGRYVKPEYEPDDSEKKDSVDIEIIVKLKKENRAFKAEKYEHSYPHCWRTDKPILYYPLDSWFINTTALRERMIELNKTINWKPESTGSGRFGNWLENMVDWNLSRSRYWGTPLPIWISEDKSEEICIGSIAELKAEIDKSIEKGFMSENPFKDFKIGDNSEENYNSFDLHRPYVDSIILVSPTGKKMYRELDLIDVWFDSGAMPYAQFHYPFDKKYDLNTFFPADFIAEGVDQTRGWFYTLHAIATLCFDNVAFKNVVSNGLVLDKHGNKMSKRLNNAVDPFSTIEKYGPDALRWYMITNSQPWDNLKFDLEGISEVQRKFFGTLYNTYNFFALYANIDGFSYKEDEVKWENRPEIDRWIISELNSLIKIVDEAYNDYEPTKAGRAINQFTIEYLSNWYVRLSRRRFWKGDYTEDKISAYQTLYKCLETIAILAAPIAPFFTEQLFCDLNNVTNKINATSVHLCEFVEADLTKIDNLLEQRMQIAQQISSLVLSLRKKTNIRVRQPLSRIIIPIQDSQLRNQIELVKDIILNEVNIKKLEFLDKDENIIVKKIKPNYKTLGPKHGKLMKDIANIINAFSQDDIRNLENEKMINISLNDTTLNIDLEDVEISTEDIPGWVVASQDNITVAMDINISNELLEEGLSRELINRIQNLRKESDFDVTDMINITIETHSEFDKIIENNKVYISSETLAKNIFIKPKNEFEGKDIEISDEINLQIFINKI